MLLITYKKSRACDSLSFLFRERRKVLQGRLPPVQEQGSGRSALSGCCTIKISLSSVSPVKGIVQESR